MMINFYKTYFAYRNKITNKLFGVVKMPARNNRRGYVLISYTTTPFTMTPWEFPSDPHTMNWECYEIARLFSLKGFEVDIINSKNQSFIPKKKYSVCIDIGHNLKRLSKYLPKDCQKVIHITFAYWKFQNEQEQKRIAYLSERKNMEVAPHRLESEASGVECADFLEGFGNERIKQTYSKFNKEIFSIPLSVSQTFDFQANKDFESGKKNFLWFGGGGAVLKGLDIVVEAFSKLPEYNLYIVGPAWHEKDFQHIYGKELKSPNVKTFNRPTIDRLGNITTDNKNIIEIFNQCDFIVYPTACDSASGSVIQAMHAGLIPIVTRESGINYNSKAIFIDDPKVEELQKIIISSASMPTDKITELSQDVWKFANQHHTRNSFSIAYSKFIDNILKI